MSLEVTIDEKKKTVTITLPLQEPRASKSGKTKVIASTNGNAVSNASYKGHPVTVGVNAYFKD